MFHAKAVMTTTIVTVHPEATIEEAFEQMLRHHVSGLLVMREDGELAGIISEFDLLHLLYEPETEKNKISDYMTADVLTVNEDDHLTDVADMFLTHSVRRLPVLRDGKVVGVISRRDLIRFIRDVRLRIANGLAGPSKAASSKSRAAHSAAAIS